MHLRVSIYGIALLAIDIHLVCAIPILPHGTRSSNHKLRHLILTDFASCAVSLAVSAPNLSCRQRAREKDSPASSKGAADAWGQLSRNNKHAQLPANMAEHGRSKRLARDGSSRLVEAPLKKARKHHWRRGRDSNPRYSCPYAAFRVRCFQPLSHLSGQAAPRRLVVAGEIAGRAGAYKACRRSGGNQPRPSRVPPRGRYSQPTKPW